MRAHRAAACAILGGLLLGCSRPPPPVAQHRLPVLPPPPAEDVVATVNGAPITVAQVVAQAKAAGQSPAEALEALVRGEILAQQADAQGLAGHPDVQRRARQEMVRRYLKEVFEKEVTPEKSVSSLEIRKAYQNALPRLVHPPLKEVNHLLVQTKKDDPQAEALAKEIRQRALETKAADEFMNLYHSFDARARAIGCQLISERVVTARQGWTEEPFAKASFDLVQPGQISPVVRTSYGYHVIRLASDIPEENVSLEEATPTIRQSLFPRVQQREFLRWIDNLAGKLQIRRYPERLQEIQRAQEAELAGQKKP